MNALLAIVSTVCAALTGAMAGAYVVAGPWWAAGIFGSLTVYNVVFAAANVLSLDQRLEAVRLTDERPAE